MQLHREQPRIEAAGARLVAVGSGLPAFVAGFRETTGWTGAVYSDPGLRSFRAAGLRRGAWRTLGPRAWRHAVAAVRAGFRQGAVRGDPWQLGGVLAAAPPDRVLYRHVAEHSGDNAPAAAIVAALGGA